MRTIAVFLWLAASMLNAQSLAGVVDLHMHSDPDSMPRSIDALDLARLCKTKGYRALLLKNHYEPTAGLAWLARKEVPGIEVYGGIALNRSVGGINPAAVEHMVQVKGGYGRVVWMPTFDAQNQAMDAKDGRPFVPVSRGGKLLPAVMEVIHLIAKNDLTLATGHSSASEVMLLIEAARGAGVKRIVVTHGMLAPVRMTVAQMQQATKLGAYIEFVYNALIGPNKMFDMPEYARAIRAVGAEHCILSSDLGQKGNPLHPDGMLAFFEGLRANGFSAEEIEMMAKRNPAAALGIQ